MHGNSLTVVVTPAGCHGLLLLLHHSRHLQHLGLALRCLLCHLCHLYFSFPFYFLLSYLSFCLAFILWDMLFIVLSSLLHLRLVLTASSPLQSCRFLVWLDPFHACLSNVFCLGHQSQHFRGLREVLVCFLFYYIFSITVLLFHFYPLKRALLKYFYSEISMFPLFHPQKGIIPLSQLENFRYSWLLVPL